MQAKFTNQAVLGILLICQVSVCLGIDTTDPNQSSKPPSYARIPDEIPLNAVKWTGGFWQDRMRRLRYIYIPGTLDGSFLDLTNGHTFRNFLKVAGLEQGGVTGQVWGDGDCYFTLDVVARLYAYRADEYLKAKMDYWIPIIAQCQREDGLIDTWGSLGGNDRRKKGCLFYNIGHLFFAALSHQRATGNDTFMTISDKALTYYLESHGSIFDNIPWAYSLRYARTGQKSFLKALQGNYVKNSSLLGPPLRNAVEIFGHGTHTAHYLLGATSLYGCTGEPILLEALQRLADNLLSKKIFITGAIAPVMRGRRPEQTIDGKTYSSVEIREAIGEEYDLVNDTAYNESCASCLHMEWLYRMFRLTGEARYMDAVERALYNAVPGCVDLDQAHFFYCNPQEQLPTSKRCQSTYQAIPGVNPHYTWRRVHTLRCSCCPPKVMRAIALSAEMAYNVNSEGLWMNLYGDNTVSVGLPGGGTLECRQTSKYPWDGKVQLVLSRVESEKPFSIFLRIPGWVDGSVRITLNGDITEVRNTSGTYYRFHRQWKSGDTMEMELPMTVRFMAAHPNVVDDWGKVAVMRGPVVYCLEGCDIPEGMTLETIYVPSNVELKPVFTEDLGGVIKLTGELVHSTTPTISVNKLVDDATETTLYREVRFAEGDKKPTGKDRYVTVSMIPYYTRLNRESDYFRIWLPLCGYKEVIAELIAKRAQLDVSDDFPSGTVFHYAAERGNTEMTELLIASGADLNAKNVGGDTPLHSAVRAGHKDIAELLIANGADVNANNNEGQTPVDIAISHNHKEIVELLIANGADVSLHTAVRFGNLAKAKSLIEKGSDINEKDVSVKTALHYAVEYGHKDVVELLIANGADVNAKDNDGNTPGHFALGKKNRPILELLIVKGADLDSIHLSAYQGDLEKVRSFIEKGTDVNTTDSYGATPLHYAAVVGHRALVEFLVARGADVNAKDKNNFASLHLAAENGHKDVVALLIDNAADINAEGQYGYTAIYWAAWSEATEVVELLLEKGVDVNTKDKWGETPLHYMAKYDHYRDMAEFLIAKGADVNAKDKQGRTPLQMAKEEDNTEIVELLRKHGAKEDKLPQSTSKE